MSQKKAPLIVEWRGRPVPINRKFGVCRGRMHTTREYRDFVVSMAWTIFAAWREALTGRIRVSLELCIPERMDVDAVVKPCYDAIQLSGIVADDNQIDHGAQDRVGAVKRGEESVIRFVIEEVR